MTLKEYENKYGAITTNGIKYVFTGYSYLEYNSAANITEWAQNAMIASTGDEVIIYWDVREGLEFEDQADWENPTRFELI